MGIEVESSNITIAFAVLMDADDAENNQDEIQSYQVQVEPIILLKAKLLEPEVPFAYAVRIEDDFGPELVVTFEDFEVPTWQVQTEADTCRVETASGFSNRKRLQDWLPCKSQFRRVVRACRQV